ncbi:LysM peptidoglycan-binding domain-containing protein [Aquabacterium lacunae]|uniref:LysM peptidoglycan-binding domain-containing protein n=1 Tax=Aquabacterium lacunae TaxID=2528630 RepID=A0A4Q9H518_9BURK|nr:peptidoglycan DD-metalloendopeptidase family protein [Aquabacterium lacunae]TBO32690.1 LysM peptidoglycan-binding domain-containing protein [Aquabacterium lacunae]
MSHSPRLYLAAALVALLAGCATQNHRAPVEDRARGPSSGAGASASATPTAPARVLPGAENAGKPGYYSVKSGDTLIRIALDSGQNWRDLAVWNNLDNPNLIEVGQVLRVAPPEGAQAVATRPVAAAPRIESRPLEAKPAAPAKVANAGASAPATPGTATAGAAAGTATAMAGGASASASQATTAGAGAAATTAAADPKDAKDTRELDEPSWTWPAAAPVVASFEEGKRKGIVLAGKSGDPVYAAADGRVVYAGSGLRGYGNLVIIKHNANYLTAYAHNQSLGVKEDQLVRKGQKIAEMGNTDADRVQLHFEIRKQGKPVDPARSLPTR